MKELKTKRENKEKTYLEGEIFFINMERERDIVNSGDKEKTLRGNVCNPGSAFNGFRKTLKKVFSEKSLFWNDARKRFCLHLS